MESKESSRLKATVRLWVDGGRNQYRLMLSVYCPWRGGNWSLCDEDELFTVERDGATEYIAWRSTDRLFSPQDKVATLTLPRCRKKVAIIQAAKVLFLPALVEAVRERFGIAEGAFLDLLNNGTMTSSGIEKTWNCSAVQSFHSSPSTNYYAGLLRFNLILKTASEGWTLVESADNAAAYIENLGCVPNELYPSIGMMTEAKVSVRCLPGQLIYALRIPLDNSPKRLAKGLYMVDAKKTLSVWAVAPQRISPVALGNYFMSLAQSDIAEQLGIVRDYTHCVPNDCGGFNIIAE